MTISREQLLLATEDTELTEITVALKPISRTLCKGAKNYNCNYYSPQRHRVHIERLKIYGSSLFTVETATAFDRKSAKSQKVNRNDAKRRDEFCWR